MPHSLRLLQWMYLLRRMHHRHQHSTSQEHAKHQSLVGHPVITQLEEKRGCHKGIELISDCTDGIFLRVSMSWNCLCRKNCLNPSSNSKIMITMHLDPWSEKHPVTNYSLAAVMSYRLFFLSLSNSDTGSSFRSCFLVTAKDSLTSNKTPTFSHCVLLPELLSVK